MHLGGKFWKMNTKKRRLGCKKEAFSPFLVEKVTNSKKEYQGYPKSSLCVPISTKVRRLLDAFIL